MDKIWTFLTFLVIILHTCNNVVQGQRRAPSSYYLNETAAMNLCSPACYFTDPEIWKYGQPPVSGSDVYLVLEDAFGSAQITIFSEVQLNNLYVKGGIVLFVNSTTLFQVDGEVFADGGYQLQLQMVNSTMIFRNFTMNGATLISSFATIIVQNFTAVNYSTVNLGNGTVLECAYCDIYQLGSSPNSVFTGDTVRLPYSTSTLYGVVNITTLIVESKTELGGATLGNVTITTNSAVLASSGTLEIGTLTTEGLSLLAVSNASVYIGMNGASFQVGKGAITLDRCLEIIMGSETGLIDATEANIQLFGSNRGYFSNILLGQITIVAPLSTVELELYYVTFTQSTELYANITTYGVLKIEDGLTVLGFIKCKQGSINVYGSLNCYDYSHVEGNLNLYGSLTSPTITVNNSVLSVLQSAQIQGHVRATNSSIILSAPLFVKGGWQSDFTAQIQLGQIPPNSDVRLNISSDIVLNGTTFYYSIASVPTSTSYFRLFAYRGTLNGTYQVQPTSLPPNLDTTLLTLDNSTNVISLVYTVKEHHDPDPLLSPGPRLWAVLGGFSVFVVLVVLVSLYFIRRRKQRHYEVINS